MGSKAPVPAPERKPGELIPLSLPPPEKHGSPMEFNGVLFTVDEIKQIVLDRNGAEIFIYKPKSSQGKPGFHHA